MLPLFPMELLFVLDLIINAGSRPGVFDEDCPLFSLSSRPNSTILRSLPLWARISLVLFRLRFSAHMAMIGSFQLQAQQQQQDAEVQVLDTARTKNLVDALKYLIYLLFFISIRVETAFCRP